MKIKKLAAAIAASVMMVASVSAADLPDQEFAGWWTSHSDGIALSEQETTITFHNVNKGNANWNNAIFVIYNGDEGKVNGAGYAETAVYRLDAYAWSVDKGDTGDNLETFLNSGFTWERFSEPNWDNFLADTQAGVDVTVKATSTSIEVSSSNGIGYKSTFAASKYLSIGGELSAISNVKYETAVPETVIPETINNEPQEPTGTTGTATGGNADKTVNTGDNTAIVSLSAIAILSLAGFALAAKKKAR